MPRKKTADSEQNPIVELKQLALRDDPDVRNYRDLLYHLSLDSFQATGQRIASGEKCAVLSNVHRKQMLKEHDKVRKLICSRYNVPGIHGGDPWNTKKADWLDTLRVTVDENPRVETNWKTSLFSPGVQLRIIPKGTTLHHSKGGTLYKLPSLPQSPDKSPPVMSFHLDLSQVKRNKLAPWVKKFKQATMRCLDEMPKPLKKPTAPWLQNVERDYERFRLHRKGMPFRWIAYHERTGRTPEGPLPGPVLKESSIRESVERVHLMLFRKKYSARRDKKLLREALLAPLFKTFSCPLHGDYCLDTCPHAQKLMKQSDVLLK